MTSSVTSPADVVNLALVRIGYGEPIASLYDGSRAAVAALNVYGQTRDEMLRQGGYGFAERNIALTLLKQAPATGYIPPLTWSSTYPPLPWMFEYTYPADCLKVRSVKAVPLFVPSFDPQPAVFSVENDNSYTPPVKVILCNVPSAIATYTGRVTDPATWETDFVEAFAAALGRRLAPLLNPPAAKMESGDERGETVAAIEDQG